MVQRFNPRLPGGRRRGPHRTGDGAVGVSIHAFRGEGDSHAFHCRGVSAVSIHAFRGEGDCICCGSGRAFSQVSIHAFRGEGDSEHGSGPQRRSVSIHAFRGEGDLWFEYVLTYE